MLTVQAIRFTDNVPAMRDFLSMLGLGTAVTSGDGWAVMSCGAGGDVLLHSAATSSTGGRAGRTDLTFTTDDLGAIEAEFGASAYDEAYGRAVDLTDPLGATVTINGEQGDLYGYQAHDGTTADPALSLTPVRFTDPAGPYGEFLARLGLVAQSGADEFYAGWVADRGVVGLHVDRPEDTARLLLGTDSAEVLLTFGYAGDVTELERRLTEAGHRVTRDTSFGVMLEVTDPDGRSVQIHQR